MQLSSYAEGLTGQAKRRYEEKLWLIGFIDPFLLPTAQGRSLATSVNLPPVESPGNGLSRNLTRLQVLGPFVQGSRDYVHLSRAPGIRSICPGLQGLCSFVQGSRY